MVGEVCVLIADVTEQPQWTTSNQNLREEIASEVIYSLPV